MAHWTLTALLLMIAALQLKHFICDGPLQTAEMVRQKSIYGAWQGVLHSVLHGVGTAVVLFVFGFPIATLTGLAILDFAIHYNVDFTKENIVKYFKWQSKDTKFWWALSADQALHQWTYLFLVALATRA